MRLELVFPPSDNVWTTDGLVVRQAAQTCVIPLRYIVEVARLDQVVQTTIHGHPAAMLRGEVLDVVSLDPVLRDSVFDDRAAGDETLPIADDDHPVTSSAVVALRWSGHLLGLLVEEVLGRHRVVVSGLDAIFPEVKSVVGVSPAEKGALSLVLDVPSLIEARHSATR